MTRLPLYFACIGLLASSHLVSQDRPIPEPDRRDKLVTVTACSRIEARDERKSTAMIGIEAFARRPSQDDPYMTVVLYNSGKPLSMVELSVYQNNDELARDVQIPLFHFTEVLLIRFKAPSMRMPAENGNAAKDDLFTKTAEARLVVIFRKFAYK